MLALMFFVYLFIIGCAIGSFLNVLIDRLPNEESILGRSHCDHCKKNLSGADLVPVLSYLFIKGRCRYCRKKLSVFYPSVELLTGISFVLTWVYAPAANVFSPGISGNLIRICYLGIISSLIVIIFADLKYKIIPDSMQISFLIFSILLHFFEGAGISSFINYFLAGLAVTAPILFIFLITQGRGMGFGDVKLAFIFGFLLGLKGGLLVLYISFLTGGIAGAVLLSLRRKGMKSTIAFGPYLVFGIVILLFFSRQINMLLYQFYGL